LNSDELTLTTPSRWRVYLFHHLGLKPGKTSIPLVLAQRQDRVCARRPRQNLDK
jgi:hypothetical protein